MAQWVIRRGPLKTEVFYENLDTNCTFSCGNAGPMSDHEILEWIMEHAHAGERVVLSNGHSFFISNVPAKQQPLMN